jgi:hypothetical protein
MATPAQLAANIANSQTSTGPRTEAGRAASSQNATTTGLFSAHDLIRPGEELFYEQYKAALHHDLSPVGVLEHDLVDSLLRAMWRLRRCGLVEADFAVPDPVTGLIPDPMQNESAARVQASVDRARAQYERQRNKCIAELRKLQTERMWRQESFAEGADLSGLGLCDWRSIQTGISRIYTAEVRRGVPIAKKELEAIVANPPSQFTELGSFCKNGKPDLASFCKNAGQPPAQPVKSSAATPRNAPCPCGSGQKHKRCCGRNAAPVLKAA